MLTILPPKITISSSQEDSLINVKVERNLAQNDVHDWSHVGLAT